MLLLVLRKIRNNSWRVLCLLIGYILALAMVVCIPVFTDSVLQRTMVRDMEKYQLSTGGSPGFYIINARLNFWQNSKRSQIFQSLENVISKQKAKELDLPILSQVQSFTMDSVELPKEDGSDDKTERKYITLGSFIDLKDHIRILHGRIFSGKTAEGVYEVIANEKTMKQMNFLLDKVYMVKLGEGDTSKQLKIKIVGIFTARDYRDAYWSTSPDESGRSILMDYNLSRQDFLQENESFISSVKWFYAFDYHKILIKDISRLQAVYKLQEKWAYEKRGSVDISLPIISLFDKYKEKQKELILKFWMLTVPAFAMLFLFIFIISRMIIEQDINEIAVLKSRGGSTLKILKIYIGEALILSLIAILAGLPAGFYLCKIMGFADGFMEFVQRKAIPLSLNWHAYLYVIIAAGILILAILIPAFLACRTSVVKVKQDKARSKGKAILGKYGFDLLGLAVAGYGIYSFKDRQFLIGITGLKGIDLNATPIMFLASSLFVFSLGLLCIRIYPHIVSLILRLGRKLWPPPVYAALISVSRSGGKEQFFMLFLIVVLAMGLFNANAARAVNGNLQDQITYRTGADITIQYEKPIVDDRAAIMGKMFARKTESDIIRDENKEMGRNHYLSVIGDYIPYKRYSEFPGAESITKVLKQPKVQMTMEGGTSVSQIETNVMGIYPDEFGKTAQLRANLLPYHWFEYLNLIENNPTAVLASTSFQTEYKAKIGDKIRFRLNGGNQELNGIIYAFVDYWPTFNPNAPVGTNQKVNQKENLIVANLSYINDKLGFLPYEIWLQKKNGVSDNDFDEYLDKTVLPKKGITYINQQLIEEKIDPIHQGINGLLTIEFILTLMVNFVGFLMYWILSIHNRKLQFGIFRALGMSMRSILIMLICEQILVSGSAFFMGVLIGGITTDTFIPLLRIINSIEQIIPINIAPFRGDYLKIYVMVAVMGTISILVLGRIVSRIKISQALKLGED